MTPFLLAMDGVRVEEIEAWHEGAETWYVLRTYFPGSIETHSSPAGSNDTKVSPIPSSNCFASTLLF
jgi:hypothetical protein